ncbi:hypothetical protein R3P38DRAFT_2758830 [Favolaschia claudopus]|uniref:Uncharacterized protein n=1 Tax=Favolaschia claudopus TaxID=2862362 RepID=A0AAW0E5P5_9AGAR
MSLISAEGDCQPPSPTQTATTAVTTAAKSVDPCISSAQPKPSTGQTKLSPTPTVRWIEGTPSSRRLPTIPNIGSAMVLRRKGAEKGEIHLILWRLHIGSVLIQIGSSIEDICGGTVVVCGKWRVGTISQSVHYGIVLNLITYTFNILLSQNHMCKLEVVESSLEGQLQRFPLNNEQKLKDTGAIAKIALALKSVRNRGCPQQLV